MRNPRTGQIMVNREQYEKGVKANRAAVRAGDPEPDKTRGQIKADRKADLARRRALINRIRNSPDTPTDEFFNDPINQELLQKGNLGLSEASIEKAKKLGKKRAKPRRVIEPGSRPVGRAPLGGTDRYRNRAPLGGTGRHRNRAPIGGSRGRGSAPRVSAGVSSMRGPTGGAAGAARAQRQGRAGQDRIADRINKAEANNLRRKDRGMPRLVIDPEGRYIRDPNTRSGYQEFNKGGLVSYLQNGGLFRPAPWISGDSVRGARTTVGARQKRKRDRMKSESIRKWNEEGNYTGKGDSQTFRFGPLSISETSQVMNWVSGIGSDIRRMISGETPAEKTDRMGLGHSGGFGGMKDPRWGMGGADYMYSKERDKGFHGYNRGGKVDSVPAMLTPGEFVVRKEAVDAVGVGTLQNINRMGFNAGGVVYAQFGRGVPQPAFNPALAATQGGAQPAGGGIDLTIVVDAIVQLKGVVEAKISELINSTTQQQGSVDLSPITALNESLSTLTGWTGFTEFADAVEILNGIGPFEVQVPGGVNVNLGAFDAALTAKLGNIVKNAVADALAARGNDSSPSQNEDGSFGRRGAV